MAKTPRPGSGAFFQIDGIAPRVELAGFWKADRDEWHRVRMPYHELILIESGRFEFPQPQGDVRAGAGDLAILRPAARAQFRTFEGATWYQLCVTFRPPPHHRQTPVLGDLGPLPLRVPLGNAVEDARRVFETVCIELPQPGVVHRLRISAAIFELLTIIAAAMVASGDSGGSKDSAGRGAGRDQTDPWERARAQLRSPARRPSVSELSRQMGLSTEHFIRRFRERFGTSPKAYEMHVKLQNAVRALRASPQRSIKAIAYELGYGDPRNLSRALRRRLGVTPRQVRKAGENVSLAEPSRGGEGGGLFIMNQHILPPDMPDDWLARFYGRRLAAQIVKDLPWAFPRPRGR